MSASMQSAAFRTSADYVARFWNHLFSLRGVSLNRIDHPNGFGEAEYSGMLCAPKLPSASARVEKMR